MNIISRIKSWFEPKQKQKIRIRFRNGIAIHVENPPNAGLNLIAVKRSAEFVSANRDDTEEARQRDCLMGMAQDRNRGMNSYCQGVGNGLSGQELGRASQMRGNPQSGMYDFGWGRW